MLAARNGVSHGQVQRAGHSASGSHTVSSSSVSPHGIKQTPCQTLPRAYTQPQELLAMLGDFLVVPTRGGAPSGIWQVEARGAAEDTPTAPTKGHPSEEEELHCRPVSSHPSRVCAVMVTRGHQGSFRFCFL